MALHSDRENALSVPIVFDVVVVVFDVVVDDANAARCTISAAFSTRCQTRKQQNKSYSSIMLIMFVEKMFVEKTAV